MRARRPRSRTRTRGVRDEAPRRPSPHPAYPSTLIPLSIRRTRPGEHVARPDLERAVDALARPAAAPTRPSAPASRSGARARRAARPPAGLGAASTFVTTGKRGVARTRRASSSGRIRSRAGDISAQWNGAETGSGIARLAPRARHACDARATAAACAGDDRLLGRVVVGRRDDLALRRLAAGRLDGLGRPSPTIAAIAPTPAGTASCMKRPRSRTSRTASAKRERAGRDVGRVLAERVARGEGGALEPLRETGRAGPRTPRSSASGSPAACWR